MDSKQLARVEIKDAAKGEVEAVFAQFDVVDKDNDVTRKGAFTDGAPIRISAFGHKSWEGALPVGKGRIVTDDTEAKAVMQFFMNTQAGRDHFEVIKEMAEEGGPGMEWSYGFNVLDSEQGEVEGKSVRVLKQLKVHEVSPVMQGAGVGTRTLGVKEESRTFNEDIEAATLVIKNIREGAERVVALRAEKSKSLSNVNMEALDGLRAEVAKLEALMGKQTEPDHSDELRGIYLGMIESELE